MAALRYADVPGYSALLVRRTYADLAMPGAIMDRAREWLGDTDARWNEQKKQWRFPSGAVLSFGYMDTERDKYRYKSAEFQFIGCDEATELQPGQYTYLFTRLRRLKSHPVPLRMRAASNPGGPGHEFFKARFVKPDSASPDRAFVPARMDDNPTLDVESYRKGLREVDPIERARIEEGDWDAVEGGRFRRESLRSYATDSFGQWLLRDASGNHVKTVQPRDCWRFLTVDPAASSEETAKSDDPDYTVVSAWAITPDRDAAWLDCHRFRLEIPDIVPQIQSVWDQYSPRFVGIEAVGANRAVLQFAQRTRMVVRELTPLGNDKLVRASRAIILANHGRLYLPQSAHWLDEARSELLRFTGNAKKDGHDDVVDTVSYMAEILAEYEPENEAMPLTLRR